MTSKSITHHLIPVRIAHFLECGDLSPRFSNSLRFSTYSATNHHKRGDKSPHSKKSRFSSSILSRNLKFIPNIFGLNSSFCLVLIFIFSNIFCAKPNAAAEPPYPDSAPWTAQWIWSAGDENARDFYLYARKEFNLPADAISAKIRVTADSRYKLFVNGTRTGAGPVKSSGEVLYYDEWRPDALFKRGTNSISALIHHYGEWTFSYVPKRGGFILEAEILLDDGRTVTVTTDGSWKVLPGEAWRKGLNRMSIQQGFPEVYDSRKAPPDGWTLPGFDDSAWTNATAIGTPPVSPWLKLVPRKTPDPFEEPFFPKEVISYGDARITTIFEGVDFHSALGSTPAGTTGFNSAYAATYIYAPATTTAKITLQSRNACKLWVDGKQLISNYLGVGVPYLDQAANNAPLSAGWTPLMVKCVNDERAWNFSIDVDAPDKSGIVFSASKSPESPGWAVSGPFTSHAGDVFGEFKRSYPPQKAGLTISDTAQPDAACETCWKFVSDTDQTPARLGSALARINMSPAHSSTFENLIALTEPSTARLPAEVTAGSATDAYFILDFGWEVSGYPYIELVSKDGGEIIDTCYTEALEDERGAPVSPLEPHGRVNCTRLGINYADRYITRPGRQKFELFDKRAFRYMLVRVRGNGAPVKFYAAALRFSTFKTGARGKFDSSSELLNRIWTVGAYTLQLNMDDSYTDCPTRERGQWWGDARIEILVNYYAFGDAALARRGILQIGESQRADGLVAGIFPTDWDNRWLPDYALIWITSALDYYRFTGDASLIPELLPKYEKLLDGFFASHENSDHLLVDVPHWVFIDWAPIEKKGAITALNAFYFRALLDAAEQFRLGGDAKSAEKYERRAALVRDSINRLMWDPERNVYADCHAGGARCKTVSEQTNALAVLFDIAPPDKMRGIMSYVMTPENNVVRAGSPYFSFYILGALRRAGLDAAAMNYVRRWGDMLKWGATTWWEMWDASQSLCHAWSSAPTYDLSRNILGVWPLEPGFSKVSVSPIPGDVNHAEGIVPTQIGDIYVSWFKKSSPESFEITVQTPPGAPAEIRIPFGGIHFPEILIDDESTLPRGAKHLQRDATTVGVSLPAGKHTVLVREMAK